MFTRSELDEAHDAINERPLLESATQRFANAIRERSPIDVAALLTELWRDGRLCVPPEDAGTTEPSIICSMGLRLRGASIESAARLAAAR